jgi:hypothetical protein
MCSIKRRLNGKPESVTGISRKELEMDISELFYVLAHGKYKTYCALIKIWLDETTTPFSIPRARQIHEYWRKNYRRKWWLFVREMLKGVIKK